MKVIRFNTPKGQFQIDLKLVAENRADYYCDKINESDEYSEEVNYVLNDDFEGIDWLINNTDFEDWKAHAIKINDLVNVTDDDFWCDCDGFEIIDFKNIEVKEPKEIN